MAKMFSLDDNNESQKRCSSKRCCSGANPTIVSYNASAVEIYDAASSLVRLENKNIFFPKKKRSSLLQR
jgi:hypothetical protein